jgi:SAM-dependent methyltransferase
MRASRQDRHYLTTEADAFFERNHAQADPRVLRPHKRRIADQLAAAGVRPRRVLEYGCGYGDLLHHFAASGASECVGVEPSKRAVELGTNAYGASVRLVQGTIADNAVNADPAIQRSFDLVVVDDVFCWVSRETLFQSIANIDDALAEGGHLFIREFFPLANRRNRNHHVDGEEVYCHKPAGPHAAIFTASGVYAVVWQQVTMDPADRWVAGAGGDPFESRWSDVVLRKSSSDYWR